MEPDKEKMDQADFPLDVENPPIDGQILKQLTEAGLNWLRTNQQIVNVLTVFPVPDGDTGTNMVLTMQSAHEEVLNSPERNVGRMAHSIAQGALMGARGNSGVILSQIWRGFARGLSDRAFLDGPSLVKALEMGCETAYKGVVRPVEGTILTVAKDIATAAKEILIETQNPYEIIARIVPAANQSVQRTPELLSVLKDAGVVDAGGKGLFFIFEGMMRYCQHLPLDTPTTSVQPLAAMKLVDTLETIEPGQDYEVVVDFRPYGSLDLADFYSDLEQIGTSIQVGEGDGLYRMHIHVPIDKRYEPIDYILSLGKITKVSMEMTAWKTAKQSLRWF
jgi:DAK2 domain fusion protein YloV